MRASIVFFFCAPLVFLSCAPRADWGTRVEWTDVDASHLPDATTHPDAGAIILHDEGKMEIFGGGELGFSTFERHTIVRILDTRGHRYANVAIPYSSGSQVDDIQARTISSGGSITVLDEKNIFDITLYPNVVLFSDQRAKIFTLPAVEDGSVVEYKYRLTVRNRTFWHSWHFQNDVPTVHSRFTLIKPSEWEVNDRVYGLDLQPKTVPVPEGFKSTHVWEARNVAALRTEFAMPPHAESVARLALAPVGFKKWEDVSRWYHAFAAPQMNAGAGLRALAARLTEGMGNDAARLRRIFEWVRDNIRYVAVEIGVGGYQPHAANEVFGNKYGDCKDMTTILCALGREAGMDVWPVLTSTWQNGRPDTSLPSPLQFNHAIAYCPSVGEGGTWMDATEKGCPFGELPWYDQGLPVLVVAERGEGRVMTTPRRRAGLNGEVVTWRALIDTLGGATIHGTTVLTGVLATELRGELSRASQEERRLWLETWLARRCEGVRLDSFRLGGLSPVMDSLVIGYGFAATHFASRSGASLVLRPGLPGSSELSQYFRAPQRTHPVRLTCGLVHEQNLHATLPENWISPGAPVADSTISQFGRGDWRRTVSHGILWHQSRFLLDGSEIRPDEYADWRTFLDQVRVRDIAEVRLTRP